MSFVTLDVEHVMGNMVFLCIMYLQKCYTGNTLGLQEKKNLEIHRTRGLCRICHFLSLLSP